MQPLLFVLEDVHWADESTLLLLQHLAERLQKMPILLLATYRDVELDVDRPLARRLEELVRRRLAHRVNLTRLPKDGVAAMIGALAGREPPASLVSAVFEETEGNCFFVEEVFHHLHEEGKLFDQTGSWRTEVQVGEIDVPEGVRLVLGRRLSRLSESARRALSAAAVIGRNFTYELAEAVDEVGGDTLLDAVEEAQRAKLITSSEDPLRPRFSFAHELIRQTLLTGLALPRRQRLHLRVAEAIERVHMRDLEPHIPDLAHHLYQAGAAVDPAKAVGYLALAGHRAMESAAFEEALRAYERSVSLQPPEDVRGLADLLVKLGFAQRSLGRTIDAAASWRSALDKYAEVGEGDAAAQVCWDISYHVSWAGRPVEAIEFVQRGLMVTADERTVVRGNLLAQAGGLIGFLGDPSGNAMIDEAFEIAAEAGDRRLEMFARLCRLIVLYGYMEHLALLDEGVGAVEVLRDIGSPWDLASVLSLIEWSYFLTGQIAKSEEVHEELAPLAERIGHVVASLLTERGRAIREFAAHPDLDAYTQFAQRDFEICRDKELEWISNAYGFLGLDAFWRGDWEKALVHARTAVDTEPPGGFSGWAWTCEFLLTAYLGREERAVQMLDSWRPSLATGDGPATWGAWSSLHAAVEGLFILGRREEAAALYDAVVATRRTGSLFANVYFRRLTQTVAGIAAHAGGRFDRAGVHFEEALRQAAELPMVLEGAEARRFYAGMLAERDAPGDRERARQLLEEALETYRSVGTVRHADLAESMLKAL
jgi:tetratricopeptide (TPR) repeat protein